MSYLVLARKWRPQGFDDLIGQEPISRILSNALTQGKIAHAYIFSGPRGVGKTSTARILAKALNCEKGPTPVPCGACGSCMSIVDGSSIDVMEIDGASNNSVNDIRDLRERVKYAPAGGRYKVYIIDEAHMLSDSAFNALLKTLEDPPSHVVFVLATTAARKIPATVLSRCQHLPFRRVPLQKIKDRLRLIAGSEEIRISETAIDLIGRAAEGSMRDSLTILDQVSAFSSDIQESEVKDRLGVADFRIVSEIAGAVIKGERKRALAIIAELSDTGADFRSFTKDLMYFVRDLLVASVAEKPEEILDLGENELKTVREILETASEDYLTVLLSEMIKAESEVRLAFSPRIALEMALIRASFLSTLKPVREAIESIESILSGQDRSSLSAEAAQDPSPEKRRADRLPDGVATAPPKVKGSEERGETLPGAEVREPSETPSAVKPDVPPVPSGVPSPVTDEATSRGYGRNLSDREFRELFIGKTEAVNHPLACKLSEADVRPEGEFLLIVLNGGTSIHGDSIRKNQQALEDIASEIAGRKVSIRIDTVKKKTPRKKELKEAILSEPIIQEAIALFDGRIVDIKPINQSETGGSDVEKDAR